MKNCLDFLFYIFHFTFPISVGKIAKNGAVIWNKCGKPVVKYCIDLDSDVRFVQIRNEHDARQATGRSS